MSTTQNTKARHYAALAARLNTLKANLDETERLMEDMAGHLLAMRTLAASNAAQFMASSRLVDIELYQAELAAQQEQAQQASTRTHEQANESREA